MDARAGNLQYLEMHFLRARGGEKGAARLDRAIGPKSSAALAWLLRHHDEEPITNSETWKRDEVDCLLEYYSLLEIACSLALVPRPLPNALVEAAVRHLDHPAVQKYIRHYPVLLPQMLLLRLQGYFAGTVNCKQAPSIFWQLLELDARLNNDACDTFLWFIDGGSQGRHDIDTMMKTLTDPKAYLRAIAVRQDHVTSLTQALHGFRIFLNFCVDFDRFLADPTLPALIRFEAWHYFSYWMRNLSIYVHRSDLRQGINQVANWKNADAANRQQTAKAVKEAREAVARLSSGEYGRLPNRR